MPHVREFSGFNNSAGNTVIISITNAVAAGHFLAVGVASRSTSLVTLSATDSRNNVYGLDRDRQTTTQGGAHLLHTRVGTTKALQAGDSIIISSNNSMVLSAAVANEFDDDIGLPDTGSAADSGASTSSAINSGSYNTTQASTLLIGVVNMVSAGRTYTPNAPYTAGAKIATTSGSGDRAVMMQWAYAAVAGSNFASGTLNSQSLWGCIGQSYRFTAPGSGRSGKPWTYNNSNGQWEPHPVMINPTNALWEQHQWYGNDGTDWLLSK